jgi:hypothetical protein
MNWYKRAQSYSDVEDFLGEFKWYQERGIGSSLGKDELVQLWNDTPVSYVDPRDLDAVGNTYTPEISGESEEDRVKNFIEYASTENREDVNEDKWSVARSANARAYLNRLVEMVKQGTYPPVNIVEVPDIGSFIIGGRTRAAAARALDVPLKVKKINIPSESKEVHPEVKKLFYDKEEE